MNKKVVGNCPRCGMPIYDAGKKPWKSCQCLPLADAPQPVYPTYPWYVYPNYVPRYEMQWTAANVQTSGYVDVTSTTCAPVPFTYTTHNWPTT